MIESVREDFLQSMETKNGRLKYKRYRNLPLRYGGGKCLGVGSIVEHIPPSVDSMVSPFMGGGAVEIACAKELGIRVRGFDIFDILVNYWQVQLTSPFELASYLSLYPPDPTTYKKVKEILKDHWDGTQPIESSIKLAAHFWFNFNLSYGPHFLGWQSKIYQEEVRYHRMVERVRSFKCPNLTAECGSFEKTIAEFPDEFLYCDPPYFLGGTSRVSFGIYPSKDRAIYHDGFNHELLRDLLANHKSGFVLSYNDCEEVRDLYKDFDIVEVEWRYSMGNGMRVHNKDGAMGEPHPNQSHELLILG